METPRLARIYNHPRENQRVVANRQCWLDQRSIDALICGLSVYIICYFPDRTLERRLIHGRQIICESSGDSIT